MSISLGSGDEVPFETAPARETFTLAVPAALAPPEPEPWAPAGRPPGSPKPAAAPRSTSYRVPLLAPLPYLLVLGPSILYSVLITGYILGIVQPGVADDVEARFAHWQAMTIALSLLLAVGEAARRRPRADAPRWLTRLPGWTLAIAAAAAAGGCAYAGVRMDTLNGTGTWAVCVAAVAAAAWFALLCPGAGVLGRAADGSHARDSRRTARLSMLGFAAGTPAAANAIYLWLLHHGPAGIRQRYAYYLYYGYAETATSASALLSSLGGLSSFVTLLVNYLANAIEEEALFAVIVLSLAHCGWNRWTIIAAAFILRALMHFYYGPPGIAMGLFSGLNAYALLRWRRLLALIVAHFVYDTWLWVGTREGWLSPEIWVSYWQLAGACLATVGVYCLLDMAVRRGRATSGMGAAA